MVVGGWNDWLMSRHYKCEKWPSLERWKIYSSYKNRPKYFRAISTLPEQECSSDRLVPWTAPSPVTVGRWLGAWSRLLRLWERSSGMLSPLGVQFSCKVVITATPRREWRLDQAHRAILCELWGARWLIDACQSMPVCGAESRLILALVITMCQGWRIISSYTSLTSNNL